MTDRENKEIAAFALKLTKQIADFANRHDEPHSTVMAVITMTAANCILTVVERHQEEVAFRLFDRCIRDGVKLGHETADEIAITPPMPRTTQ